MSLSRVSALRLFIAGLILASLAGCSSIASVAKLVIPSGNRLDWSGLTVIASPDANLNTPVALDIVRHFLGRGFVGKAMVVSIST